MNTLFDGKKDVFVKNLQQGQSDILLTGKQMMNVFHEAI
jgi:hypothetical protein